MLHFWGQILYSFTNLARKAWRALFNPKSTTPLLADLRQAPIVAPQPVIRTQAEVDRERRSALMKAFDTSHPVERRRDLHGRDTQLDILFEAMLFQHKHALVHGARGSGKTSLVFIFGDHADQRGLVPIYIACDAKAGFAELMRPFLRFIPKSSIPIDYELQYQADLAALGNSFGPRELVALLSQLSPTPIIFILDEFDRIVDPDVQDAVATCMKLLSDAHAPVLLLVVGIARSASELVEHHPSLRRHMTAVKVSGIADEDIAHLVDTGAARVGLKFDETAKSLVVEASTGSPYHARVFAFSAGLRALLCGNNLIDRKAVVGGLYAAIEAWGRLNERDDAIFRRLASRDADTRAALVALAASAARSEPVMVDRNFNFLIELLGQSVDVAGIASGELRFRDTSAPQFLIASLVLSGGNEVAGPVRLASTRE